MARYVVLEFADNSEADAFVEACKRGITENVFFTKLHTPEGSYEVSKVEKAAAVVGYYMRPTLPCACRSEDRNKQFGYARGSKYGLWVHTAPGCAKVASVALEFWAHSPGLGRNMLIDDLTYEGFLRLEGDGSTRAVDWFKERVTHLKKAGHPDSIPLEMRTGKR